MLLCTCPTQLACIAPASYSMACGLTAVLLTADNNQAESASQPPPDLFRSGELAFGSFEDELKAEVRYLAILVHDEAVEWLSSTTATGNRCIAQSLEQQ